MESFILKSVSVVSLIDIALVGVKKLVIDPAFNERPNLPSLENVQG